VVSFTALPSYPCGKNPRYPSDRRLGGPQSSDLKIFYPNRDSNSDPSVVQPVASRCTDCATVYLNMRGVLNVIVIMTASRKQSEH
jgi:hypothetical protein